MTTAKALGINTELAQANHQVETPKDVNKQLDEQRQIREAAGHIQTAVNKYIDVQQKAVGRVNSKDGDERSRHCLKGLMQTKNCRLLGKQKDMKTMRLEFQEENIEQTCILDIGQKLICISP